jgi:DNA-binding LacI/PurR family transcriptional regulator
VTAEAGQQEGSGAPARRPTIRDVAHVAQVSHQTVARYLRGDPTVNQAMARRIDDAVAVLGYRPNLVARAMRSGRTGRLALLLPTGDAISSLEVLAGAQEAAHQAGYALELMNLDGSNRTWATRVLELADSGLFEGVVSLMPLPPGLAATSRTPILENALYDERMHAIGPLASAPSMGEIVEGLAALGHRTFLHLAGDYAHASARARRDVYLESVERLGLTSAGVVECDWLAERARSALLDLPEDSAVTAVVAANDVLAAGALGAAVLRGWSVPGRISVTGWDANPLGAALTPAITTVEVANRMLGHRAVQASLVTLTGAAAPADDEPVTRVIWRSSTGPAPAGR